jgi:ABC-type cobalamin/Fe3+-siderophores transport system ATPase subunit
VPFSFSIPRDGLTALELSIGAGEVILFLGANGTGKSSLMHRFYSAHRTNARRVTAHRQTWFESNAITLSPQQRQQTENNIQAHDSQPQARWKEDYAAARSSIAIYDLVDAENVRARDITSAVDNDNFDLAKELRKKDAPIKIINELLRLSNIPVAIAIHENAQVIASKNGSAPYSIAELSDGERNAILIAANVLTAKQGTLLLIDEPERHLHRSIISPLLTLLFAKRRDCAFVVSTHDVMLPFDNPAARTLLIRGCSYNGSAVTTWDADLVSSGSGIDDDLRRDILGARRKILFVEGIEKSLDKPLYSLVFPDVSVIAKGSCRDVERAVLSIRDADGLHWLDAFGLVDNDGHPQVEIDHLKGGGVYATTVFSVEGVYYHPEVQRRVAERHASTTGDDFNMAVAEGRRAALAAVAPHVQRLSERVAEKLVREEFFRHIPNRDQISDAAPVNVSIDVQKIVGEESARLREALDAGDMTTIVSRYPVRETPALDTIARRLGFQDRDQYEGAVRKLLMDEPDSLTFVRSLFGTLATDITAGSVKAGTSVTDPAPTMVG